MPEGFWARVEQTIESNIILCRRVTYGLTASASDCCLGMPVSGAERCASGAADSRSEVRA
jgi:hypothetical protein